MIKYFFKKIFLRRIFKKIFINFLKTNRYNYNEFEITYIPINKNKVLPNNYLKNISDKAYNNLINNFNNNTNVLNKELDGINDLSNHYLLLTSLCEICQSKKIVEVGTASGISLSSFLKSKFTEYVYTWDIYPLSDQGADDWFENSTIRDYVKNILKLNSNRYKQYVEDLNDSKIFDKRKQILENADLIFIDGPHNGIFEKELFNKMSKLNFKKNTILILDDIKVSSMVNFWTSIDLPKLDISHLGHQTGTGLVKLNN